MTKIKINPQWFRNEIIRNETGKIREQREHWYNVLKDHGFIGDFQFEVRVKETGTLYGLRVGFFDNRLYRNKLYVTVTPGNYEIIE